MKVLTLRQIMIMSEKERNKIKCTTQHNIYHDNRKVIYDPVPVINLQWVESVTTPNYYSVGWSDSEGDPHISVHIDSLIKLVPDRASSEYEHTLFI